MDCLTIDHLDWHELADLIETLKAKTPRERYEIAKNAAGNFPGGFAPYAGIIKKLAIDLYLDNQFCDWAGLDRTDPKNENSTITMTATIQYLEQILLQEQVIVQK